MRVLYWPQLSMRSYIDNRWLFSSDAQVTKMVAYMEALPDDWTWHWVVPGELEGRRSALESNWYTAFRGIEPEVHPLPWMDNVLQGRYFFPMREVIRLLDTMPEPDVMLLEVPELARPMRLVQQVTGVRFPIISMVEHVDFYEQTRVPEQVSYYLRQIDGALVSEALAFPLRGMQYEWRRAMEDLTKIEPRMVHDTVWDAIYSPREVDAAGDWGHGEPNWPRKHGVPVINFISRLSDNQRTHFEEFFEAVRILERRGERFEVWVANPNEALTADEVYSLKAGESVTKAGYGTRAEYLWSLHQSDIVPILYPQSHIYSLGFCEAVTAGNLMVTTKDPGGHPIIPGVRPLHPMEVTPSALADVLGEALEIARDPDSELRLAYVEAQADWLEENRSVEANIDKVRTTIEEVVAGVRS